MLSILPPFAERHEEPIIVFCYCCWLVFVLFPDTISRQRTPSWIRSVVSFFPFSFNENATTAHKRYTRIPVSSMKHNKTIALNKLAKSIFLLSLSVYLCRSRHCMCVCVLCTIFNEMNWIEKKTGAPNPKWMRKECCGANIANIFSFNFPCMNMYWWLVYGTRWWYKRTHSPK